MLSLLVTPRGWHKVSVGEVLHYFPIDGLG